MDTIHMRALTADYMTPELAERATRFNAAAATWGSERKDRETKIETTIPKPASQGFEAVGSWIAEGTFRDADEALQAASDIKRRRLSSPIEGLKLLTELNAIREAATSEWTEHTAKLRADLDEAETKARKEADGFKGLSPAAKSAHVADQTADARQACMAANPISETWHGWKAGTIQAHKETLLREIQEAFAGAIR